MSAEDWTQEVRTDRIYYLDFVHCGKIKKHAPALSTDVSYRAGEKPILGLVPYDVLTVTYSCLRGSGCTGQLRGVAVLEETSRKHPRTSIFGVSSDALTFCPPGCLIWRLEVAGDIMEIY